MKIVEIHIYGYGKFENTKFSNLDKQQVFFGENEAGKSTIMSFIHSMLFGFPTKQQSELRFEPKHGTKYGGQLTLLFPTYGLVIIERVKGKATGDVLVRLENGEMGGEELLEKLLSSVDKSLFQAIFSFNLHGLQNIHQMKQEDIGRYLFSTGTVGSDRLLKVENEIEKELESRFKPNGRNPEINRKLKELTQLRREVQKAEERNNQYIRLLTLKESIEKKIEEKKVQNALYINELNRLEEWKKVLPLYEQEKKIKKELHPFDSIHFPEGGLEEHEQLQHDQTQLNRKITLYEQRLERLEEDIKKIKPNMDLIQKENEINSIAENISLLENYKQENIQLNVTLKNLNEEIKFLQSKIHLPHTENEILSLNTSIFMKDKTAELQDKYKRILEKKRELDEQFQLEKSRLEDLEAKEQAIKSELMEEHERQIIKHRLARYSTKDTLANQVEDIEARLVFLSTSLQELQKKNNSEKMQHILFSILFILLSIGGIFLDEMLLIIIGGIGFIFSLFLLVKGKTANSDEFIKREIRQLEGKKREYESSFHQTDEQFELLQQRLERDSHLREKLFQLSVKMERQQEDYEHVIDQFEQWELDELKIRQQIIEIGKKLMIPEDISLKYLYDAFQMLDGLKGNYHEREKVIERLHTNQLAIEDIVNPMEGLSLRFLQASSFSHHEAVRQLKDKLRMELEKQVAYKEKNNQIIVWKEELKELQHEWEKNRKDIDRLYQIVHVENEEHFQEIGKKAEQKKYLMEQRENILMQVRLSSFSKEEAENLLETFSDLSIQEVLEKREQLEEELSKLYDEYATLKYEIQVLEDGGIYADLLHQYKQLESEFQTEAKEWATYAVAKRLLQNTVDNYKKERMPKMLQKAEEYLEFLTDGNYIRIIPKQTGNGFYIENKNKILFEANELSQATTEQVYVSIRLALATTIYEKYRFPIIIDDSFVNFDAMRTSKIVGLLKNLSAYQVILFTCHDHILNYFDSATIISLK